MSETYSSRFNNAARRQQPEPISYHRGESHARNLSLVMADGAQLFLAYASLLSGTFAPDIGTITLAFATHLVSLRGRNLSALFDSLAAHTPARITAANERYADADDNARPLVTEITVKAL